MPSNHAAWQPSLTIHLASAKIKLTTVGLTQRLGELGNYFDNRSNSKRPVLRVMKIEKSQKNTRDIIKDMEIPITQSKEWQKLQNDLGKTSFFESASDFQYLAILNKTPVGNYLYLPYGPVAKDEKSFQAALTSLNTIAKKTRAIFIRVEPQSTSFIKYLPKNSRKSKDLNPKETWVLDLTGNDEGLKQKLPSRLLRYYKSANSKSITIETSCDPEDIKYLLNLQKALAKEKGISTFSEDYLKAELSQPFATLYLVKYHNNDNTSSQPNCDNSQHIQSDKHDREDCKASSCRDDVVAAGLVFDDKYTRYNLQGAQSEQGRKLHATGILTIQLILDAKVKSLHTFDFWGIAPEGAPSSHPWAGFTNFKKTFAGREVDYAGTYDIILSSTKYHLYQLTRKINRFLRRI